MEDENQTIEYKVEEGVMCKVVKVPVNVNTRLSEINDMLASHNNELAEIKAKIKTLEEEQSQLESLI